MCTSEKQRHPTPVLLPGKSHGQRSLGGCSPWGREESDMTKRLHFHFSLSCTGEAHGNPLQCSCWRIPGTGAWWAAVSGVAQSRTRLKRLSGSSSSSMYIRLADSFRCTAGTNTTLESNQTPIKIKKKKNQKTKTIRNVNFSFNWSDFSKFQRLM